MTKPPDPQTEAALRQLEVAALNSARTSTIRSGKRGASYRTSPGVWRAIPRRERWRISGSVRSASPSALSSAASRAL